MWLKEKEGLFDCLLKEKEDMFSGWAHSNVKEVSQDEVDEIIGN